MLKTKRINKMDDCDKSVNCLRKALVTYRNYKGACVYETSEREVLFHCFGSEGLETESSVASHSIAIVEWSDGTLEKVPVNSVRFLDRHEKVEAS
jgi:hypothetical protein